MHLLVILCFFLGSPQSWPSFLGRGATHAENLEVPLEWNPSEIAWKASLPGHGQSSPVAWNGQVYLTAVEGKNKERYHLLAFSSQDGSPRWRYSLENAAPLPSTMFVSRAAPTPCADERGVYAFFESGQLVALDHEGKERWSRDLAKDYGKFEGRFGLGASPAQDARRLYLLVDHEGPSYVVALEKDTGKTAWRTERSSRVSWSSPIVTTIAGVPQLVVSSAGSVDGYSLNEGERLWSFEDIGGNTVNTPCEFAEGKFLIGASPGEGRDIDRRASRSNLALHVTRDEQGNWKAEPSWVAERVSSAFGSPIAHRGLAYYVNRAGVLYAIDLETGERRYEERLGTSCWATAIPLGDRIYFFGKDGDTVVVRAGETFEKLAENRLWEPGEGAASDPGERGAEQFGGRIQYGVALLQDRLLVRTGDVLYALPCGKKE